MRAWPLKDQIGFYMDEYQEQKTIGQINLAWVYLRKAEKLATKLALLQGRWEKD